MFVKSIMGPPRGSGKACWSSGLVQAEGCSENTWPIVYLAVTKCLHCEAFCLLHALTNPVSLLSLNRETRLGWQQKPSWSLGDARSQSKAADSEIHARGDCQAWPSFLYQNCPVTPCPGEELDYSWSVPTVVHHRQEEGEVFRG